VRARILFAAFVVVMLIWATAWLVAIARFPL
jgi:hypothetical protein